MKTETKATHTPDPMDFGTRASQWSLCHICGSKKHVTLEHSRLNNAAPELLKALKRIAELNPRPVECFDIAIAAIAKAEKG